ncbi:MAG: CoA-binding protein, partial [Promethearchaeota archaeon]
MSRDTFKDLSFIDDIKSVVVVGPSRARNYFFLRAFSASFKGTVYAVKPGVKKIEQFPTVPVYSRISDLPDSVTVDFAFIALPREKVLEAVESCAKKGIKLVAIFSSNFADEGTKIGRELQLELEEIVRAYGNMRVLGPNGMGLYFPRIGLRWRPSLPSDFGSIGIVSQSGGLSNLMIHELAGENLFVSKAFSIGNSIDVNVLDVLHYLIQDQETEIIAAYIEGIPRNSGRDLMELIRSSLKPIVIIKGGLTELGVRAAVTHTGALVGDSKLWYQAMHQSGGIVVETLSDLINVVKYLKLEGDFTIDRACLISLSGGFGVVAVDTLSKHGITLPAFTRDEKIKSALKPLFNVRGTSFNNPIDLAAMLYQVEKLEEIIGVVLSTDKIDGLIFEIAPLYLAHQMRADIDLSDEIHSILENAREKFHKPILVILPPTGYEDLKNKLKGKLQASGIAVYHDILSVSRV